MNQQAIIVGSVILALVVIFNFVTHLPWVPAADGLKYEQRFATDESDQKAADERITKLEAQMDAVRQK